jgi:hypothetical protein
VSVVVVGASVTVAVVTGDVLAANVLVCWNWAVIASDPTGSVVVVSVATPFTAVEEPSDVVPLKKFTVPETADDVPAPELTGVIVAVIVTVWPENDVSGATVIAVVVGPRPTVTVDPAERSGS